MSPQAKINSTDEIKQFHAYLTTYVVRVRAVLDEVHEEVMRTRQWLEGEQRTHWQREVKRCQRALDDAQQALLRVKMSGLRDSTGAEQAVVSRARKDLEYAEEKLARTRKWRAVYDGRVALLEKGLSGLRNWVDYEIPKAMIFLNQTVDNLDAYQAGSASISEELRKKPDSEDVDI